MSDHPRMQQVRNRPGSGQPAHPAPSPAPAKPLTAAGPLLGTDTIMVARDGGLPVPVPLSVVAAFCARSTAANAGGR